MDDLIRQARHSAERGLVRLCTAAARCEGRGSPPRGTDLRLHLGRTDLHLRRVHHHLRRVNLHRCHLRLHLRRLHPRVGVALGLRLRLHGADLNLHLRHPCHDRRRLRLHLHPLRVDLRRTRLHLCSFHEHVRRLLLRRRPGLQLHRGPHGGHALQQLEESSRGRARRRLRRANSLVLAGRRARGVGFKTDDVHLLAPRAAAHGDARGALRRPRLRGLPAHAVDAVPQVDPPQTRHAFQQHRDAIVRNTLAPDHGETLKGTRVAAQGSNLRKEEQRDVFDGVHIAQPLVRPN
jgi:hypothetical protein